MVVSHVIPTAPLIAAHAYNGSVLPSLAIPLPNEPLDAVGHIE